MNKVLVYTSFLVFFFGCKKTTETVFSIVPSKDSGVTFSNTLTDTNDQNILDYLYYYNGGGVAIGDINNDGLPDIYFIANQLKNKLYLNKGNFKFEDISLSAGIEGNSDWNTGVTMVDINNDGYLDIYISAVVGINGFRGRNELFINNKDNTFTERAEDYNLNLESYASSASFFDYDLDGDLDVYILNHAIHTQDSFGKASIRNNRNEESGDKLLRNDDGKFIDVSEQAGIFGGVNGYGLGVAISDFNLDGFPDLYVSNDFHEDDYYYLNNGNGTFTESIKEKFGHTSRFSMGSDVADIDNDGDFDLMTLDMLPEDETVLKSSAGDDNVQMHEMRTGRLGYHNQYTRNMLQINQNGDYFTETALLSNIAATDWSWSVLFQDFDQDGNTDFFVTNGIPKRPNDLDYINYISNSKIKNKLNTTTLVDKAAFDAMPEGKVSNYFFKGNKGITFSNKTKIWANETASFSNGAAYGDLDNDGDLDLVTNNINSEATLYRNKTNKTSNYLKIKLKNGDQNHFGIGTKCMLYYDNGKQAKELFTSRGFQSSSEPLLHFGLDKEDIIKSLVVIWPNNTFQRLENVKANQTLVLDSKEAKSLINYADFKTKEKQLFIKSETNLGINYRHVENKNIDFNRQKLIPYKTSDRGPIVSIGDLNNDQKDDIFIGGTKYSPAQLYLQQDSTFIKQKYDVVSNDSLSEDTSAIIRDFNGDNRNDLLVASGGGEFFGKKEALANRLYTITETNIKKDIIQEDFNDTSVIKAYDFDNDGDLDLFVGNATVVNDFGAIPPSYLLKNDDGNFTKLSLSNLESLGMVRDAVWTDFNNDKKQDLIVVGEWMTPRFLQNNGNTFDDVTKTYVSEKLNGLWRAIIPFDIDKDGDTDYLLGNWGTNTKFKATEKEPMLLFYDDFDNNNKTETIIATAKNKKYYTLEGLDGLSSQLISLTKKKFPTYHDFAGKDIYDVFGKELLDQAKKLEVHTLASGILKNNNGTFKFEPFKNDLQVAPINCFINFKINDDDVVLCAGNYFGVTPYHGRFDGFSGALIKNEKDITLGGSIGLDFFQKSVTNLQIITVNGRNWLIAALNNEPIQIYKID